MNATELRDLIDRTENVKPITEGAGDVKIVTFEEQRDLAMMDAMNETGLNLVQYNPDGTVARTPVKYAAVNPANYFINRYKKVRDTMYVVNDYRAIKEQDSGSIYVKTLPAYVIKRDEEKKLVLEKVVNISDTEFLADFTKILSREAMAEVLPLITQEDGVTADGLPI